ncbi:DAHL domain-containing protein [Rhodopila sp.]|uniref:DAHL domain-containing protein n=1 Tax=Rhodopila sp. TaxID=2480087 RepID=UPI003D11381C
MNPTESTIPAASRLVTAMLHLTLDTSPMTVNEVETLLNKLAEQRPPPGDGASVQALLAHGRLLYQLLQATDDLIKGLRAFPQNRDRDALRAMIVARQTASRTTARQFWLLLYFTSRL